MPSKHTGVDEQYDFKLKCDTSHYNATLIHLKKSKLPQHSSSMHSWTGKVEVHIAVHIHIVLFVG